MALLHRAVLRPSKTELLSGWASSQPWFDGDATVEPTSVAAYRFDDPEGEVGVETLLVRSGDGPTLQVPLTYRNEPLPGGERWFVGNLDHSVLGTRWVYDAVGDPVYLLTVASAIMTGGTQAGLFVEIDGQMVEREPSARVAGSGAAGAPRIELPTVAELSVRDADGLTTVETSAFAVVVARRLDAAGPELRLPASVTAGGVAGGVLTGTWAEQPEPKAFVLAYLR